ncbi:unnamed protein product [Periconia digitata]|uniref:Serine/threonine-protein kinase Tel1 n=1 Tax=Periconia digitata TaxID=1303443 RepID=A0A9W4XWP8_9PLEO|nr:unnamed protein product [Periconia digitata]
MAVTTIQDAKVLISSAASNDRTNGLKGLVHILKHNRGKPTLESLGNKAYLSLCETLLQCMHDERHAFLKSKAKIKSKATDHLVYAANALRHVIYSGVRAIKSTTVEFIVSTIIDTLPGHDGSLVAPLLEDVPKTLRALLEYQPHVERLSSACWDTTLAFCIDSLAGIFVEPEVDQPASWSTGISSRGRTPFDSTDVAIRSSDRIPSSSISNVSPELIRVAEDLVHCLALLVKASNSPILPQAERILRSLIHYMCQKAARGKAAALSAINAIIPRITLHSSVLARHVVVEVLPLMKTLWADSTVRDEIFVTLTYSEVHIASILQGSTDESFGLEVEAFLDVIYGDYRRRQDTTAHQYLEDDYVCFRRIGRASKEAHSLCTQAFAMDPGYSRYEGLWATVSCIARLSTMLDEHNRRLAHSYKDDEAPSKRPRITRHFQEYLRHVSEPRSNAKRAALQVIAFIVQEGPLDEEELQSLLGKLMPCISDENAAHSSWALISLAAAAFQRVAKSNALSHLWVSAWKTASRVITSSSSSRAACHFMDVVLRLKVIPYSAVSETVQTMLTSVELNGPALLTESTTSLMTTLIQEVIAGSPTHYKSSAERVLNWLLSKWTPSLWSERSYVTLHARHFNARDILRVLHACLDRPFMHFRTPPYKVMGPIAQARLQTNAFHELSRYILLLDDTEGFTLELSQTSSSSNTSPSGHVLQLEDRILDFCLSELDKTKQRWTQRSEHSLQNITSDMLQIIVNLCIVSSAVGSVVKRQDPRIVELGTVTDRFARSFTQVLTKPQIERYKIDAVLETCAQSLQDIDDLEDLSSAVFKNAGMLIIANHLSSALDQRRDIKQSFYTEDDGFMDIDDEPNSQATAGTSSSEIDIPRHEISASSEAGAFNACCSTYIHLIQSVGDMFDQDPDCVPSEFIEYLISIPEADLLRSRQFTSTLMQGRFRISQGDAIKLLERLSDALIDPRAREYNTSEVANGMMLDVLIGSTHLWSSDSTDHETRDLYENVEALYAYYIKGMEKSGVRRSPGLQMRLATFLHGLLRHHPNFGQSRKIPSVRTSLFGLLGSGEMAVKYHIVDRLSDIFEYFVFSEHNKILGDIDENLPSDKTWLEGIAIRLLVFSNLASRWYTVQRLCIYRMFATAGSIAGATRHAKRCISKVAAARNMGDSQALFRLFASQIIHTWLDRGRTFAEMPFETFGYETLVSLLRDVEAETVGQAIMRGQKHAVEYLATIFGDETRAVLARNMPKAAAYTISWDTCTGYARNKSVPSSCNILRDLVGKDQYAELILQQFPQVLGHIFQTIDQEDRVSKQLDKRPAFHDASKALAKMNNISHSTAGLEIEIEPSFSAYYLNDQLERLCRRTGDNPDSFWTSSNYTLVARMLLDRIHPALGPLYARSIIRKLRILVALAGPVACEGYPLQMTLQSLRPFLTDIQCAEDVVGIMQYLLDRGETYLTRDLGFVTGIGLSVLISIRVFLGSSQESTTQQSQYMATMNTATKFHGWFSQYLTSYADNLADTESNSHIKAFRLITTAASQVRTEGNSLRGSEESKLLREILDDVRSGRKLLNNTSREVALDLLCQNFQPAPTAKDDMFESDAEAAEYAIHVWQSCQRTNVGDGYLLWAARVLGRAFSAYGEVRQDTASSKPWLSLETSADDSLGRASREAIIREVIGVFYSDDRHEVSLAEESIRLTLARLSQAPPEYVAELNEIIPQHITKALGLSVSTDGDSTLSADTNTVEQCAAVREGTPVAIWTRDLAISLCSIASQEPLLGSLPRLLLGISQMAAKLFPYILHLVLLGEFEGECKTRRTISRALTGWFSDPRNDHVPQVRIFIQTILYLRTQPVPKEVTRVDRDQWLDVDFVKAAEAAATCDMYRSALLFAETAAEPAVKTSRRSSSVMKPAKLPIDLQLSIYKNLDEPDSFYGVDRGYSLQSVMDRVDYEGDGVKSLLFRGARLDSQIQQSGALQPSDTSGMVRSLIMLNMNSVTHSLLSNDQFRNTGEIGIENTLHTARKLGQWDIKAPEMNHSEQSTLFKAFQGLHYAIDTAAAQKCFDKQLLTTVGHLSSGHAASMSTQAHLRTLAILTEAHEVVGSRSEDDLLDIWDQMKGRELWMRAGEFENVRQILSCRETLFNILSANEPLLDSLRVRKGSVRSVEVQALVSSSRICRRHGALQESLARVTYLSGLVQQCKDVGLEIEAVAQHEVASVLWDQGEAETSTGMRRQLIESTRFDSQDDDISLPVILAKLGHHLAESRLEKPDGIIRDYLQPAIQELKGQTQGSGPAQVFHGFALFCDKQLQSPEAIDDVDRAKAGVDRRFQEYNDFMKLANAEKSKSMRDTYRRNASKSKTWYNLDHAEYERLRKGREQFLRQCLENYLLSLQASDQYNNDALRVFSLWLENADLSLANDAVGRYLNKVPSGKFALLMNQLSSRLQSEQTAFQKLLLQLVLRICMDHPYHGMHQIFAIQTKVGAYTREDMMRSKDESARSRQKAAAYIAQQLDKDKRSQSTWRTIYRSNEIYHALAMFKDEKDNRQGREYSLDRYRESKELVQKVPPLRVPPATLQIEVRANQDYSDLPRIVGFGSRMTIANGLSAPKIITAKGSDGKPYKQLFKSGNDDLRQDAIMEQVFDQVSRLLKNHTATRLRNLGIRTYKVLPLSTRSGLMEFVQDTVPLHVWVMPAHEKYYPNDLKPDQCRKQIGAVQQDTQSTRIKTWQKVANSFHPVLRYFLLELFQDPDEWFQRRLAYTRSTAAISILGHVLGLGDRHCHNILLDKKSGDVVHIDLGVSFEAGRVLPVPEVVPFRLTRDLVDAMGYTKTEGVFRRCCEFTMDTLREERESIMTLLNVLRYDPLVNWSITSTKAKRMQEGQETAAAAGGAPSSTAVSRAGTVGGTPAPADGAGATAAPQENPESSKKKDEEQAGEAGRALAVVEKKLGKTLSTKATVNELIQAATDEGNLAVLYQGWASYA